MPASVCPPTINYDLSKDNQRCRFLVELTWDGTSTPATGCDGTVSRVSWSNTGQKTYYAHLPFTRQGPAVYQIVPGSSGEVTTRSILHAAGLDNASDVHDNLDLNLVPPQAGERLLNP